MRLVQGEPDCLSKNLIEMKGMNVKKNQKVTRRSSWIKANELYIQIGESGFKN